MWIELRRQILGRQTADYVRDWCMERPGLLLLGPNKFAVAVLGQPWWRKIVLVQRKHIQWGQPGCCSVHQKEQRQQHTDSGCCSAHQKELKQRHTGWSWFRQRQELVLGS